MAVNVREASAVSDEQGNDRDVRVKSFVQRCCRCGDVQHMVMMIIIILLCTLMKVVVVVDILIVVNVILHDRCRRSCSRCCMHAPASVHEAVRPMCGRLRSHFDQVM